MSVAKKIVFLHIPKTAGQSVRKTLGSIYGEENLSPVLVNRQWRDHPPESLLRYRVFTGHLDWDKLDFVPSPKIVFTILREPLERIASFYLYMRAKSEKMSAEARARGGNTDARLIHELSIDDYFCKPDLPQRRHINGLYDNFYTHYLAGRSFRARAFLRKKYGTTPESRQLVYDLALQNAQKLDLIGDVRDMAGFSRQFSALAGTEIDFVSRKVNVNRGIAPSRSRFEALLELNPSAATIERLHAFAELDTLLYRQLCPQHAG